MVSKETVKHFILATTVSLFIVGLILVKSLVFDSATTTPEDIVQLNESDSKYVQKLDELVLLDTDSLVREVNANPGEMPTSLKLKSQAIRHLFLEISNEVQAKLFVKHLKPCAKEGSSSPLSLKSVCISYMHQTMLKYPRIYSAASAR